MKNPCAVLALAAIGCAGEIGPHAPVPSGDPTPALPEAPLPRSPVAPPETGVSAPPAGTPVPPPGTPAPAPVVSAGCTATPGWAPLRRLDRFAYDNAVRDLLGDETRPAQALPAEESHGPFSSQAEILSTSPLLVQGYVDISDGIAARAVKNRLAALVPCAPASGDETCARKFLETFGRRAWRRPMAAADVDELIAVYRAGAADGGGFAGGIQTALEALLQAPDFLYLAEPGTPGANGVRRLTSWEIAARLAYVLWGSVPDDVLLAAAEADQLASKTQIAAQARRLLADRRARPLIQRFSEEWLGIIGVTSLGKDTKLVPQWKSGHAALFREETRRFFEELVFAEKRPSALTLFTGRESFMNAELTALYGVTGGPASSTFAKVTLPENRAGVLTQMSLMATYARSNQTDPIHRGKFVRLNLLCGELPSAPNDVEIKPPALSATLTTRERFAQHASDPFCAACHKLMDGIGLSFESYDAMGVFRSQENGKPVDTSGELVATDVDGKVASAIDVAARLGRSPQARACIVRHWFRFAFGREEAAADACTIAQLTAAFEKNGFDLAGLILDSVQSETFGARAPRGML